MNLFSITSVLLIIYLSTLSTGFNINAQTVSEDKSHCQKIEVVGLNDPTNYVILRDKLIYLNGWDTLNQPNFWRKLMQTPPDSGYINIGSTRQILAKWHIDDWENLPDEKKQAYRDSIKQYYNLPETEHIYFTSGKSDFYRFENVLEAIHKAIPIFEQQGVDPFYAEAILLIESPNKLQKSPVGADGHFQLMKKVAIQMGLKVNKQVDERKDFDKSAMAAAKLIKTVCIPYTDTILKDLNIPRDTTALWYRLLVLHVYHAGAYNVRQAAKDIKNPQPSLELIKQLWTIEKGNFRNASQNYSQLILASLMEFEKMLYEKAKYIYVCE